MVVRVLVKKGNLVSRGRMMLTSIWRLRSGYKKKKKKKKKRSSLLYVVSILFPYFNVYQATHE